MLAHLYTRTSESDWSIKQNTCLSFCIRLPVIFLYSPSKFVTTSHAYKDPRSCRPCAYAAVNMQPCSDRRVIPCASTDVCCLHLTIDTPVVIRSKRTPSLLIQETARPRAIFQPNKKLVFSARNGRESYHHHHYCCCYYCWSRVLQVW